MLPDLELGNLIKELRQRIGMNIAELGKKAGVQPVHISYIEKGQRTPSEELLKRLAEIFGKDQIEIEKLKEQFLFLLTKIRAPQEVRNTLSMADSRAPYIITKEGMPLPFIERLKKDIEKKLKEDQAFYESLKIDSRAVEETLVGRTILPRKSVIELALKLGQSVEEYLILADYMPEEIKTLVRHNGMVNMFKTLGELSPEELDEMTDVITRVLKAYIKKGKRHNGPEE